MPLTLPPDIAAFTSRFDQRIEEVLLTAHEGKPCWVVVCHSDEDANYLQHQIKPLDYSPDENQGLAHPFPQSFVGLPDRLVLRQATDEELKNVMWLHSGKNREYLLRFEEGELKSVQEGRDPISSPPAMSQQFQLRSDLVDWAATHLSEFTAVQVQPDTYRFYGDDPLQSGGKP
jgi:hypothetical protein